MSNDAGSKSIAVAARHSQQPGKALDLDTYDDVGRSLGKKSLGREAAPSPFLQLQMRLSSGKVVGRPFHQSG